MRETLHHVGLVSADIERSISFYSGPLGLELLARGRESGPRYAEMFGVDEVAFLWAELDLGGGHLLELIEYEPAPERPAAAQPAAGLPAGPHFALRVPDVDAVHEALSRHGAKVFSLPSRASTGPPSPPSLSPICRAWSSAPFEYFLI